LALNLQRLGQLTAEHLWLAQFIFNTLRASARYIHT